MGSRHASHCISAAALIVTLGIIYGDIGTSPLYVLKAIVGTEPISREVVLGGLSCIFWTLTLQTTIKYVFLTLQADNKGEGGIFSLFALVRRRTPWLIIPAILGGSALLADGLITPPISVTSAVEGLQILDPEIPVVSIVICILIGIFTAQQLGTKMVGNAFGPVMLIWFLMLAILGMSQIIFVPVVLEAVSPVFALKLVLQHPHGFWLLGAVFLCTTGAEALYSDLGHCGRENIRITWIFVKSCLLLNYAGQSAWLLLHEGELLGEQNPFFTIMPHWFLVPGIIIATLATIIASQALISGSFTLVTEAMRLYLFPKAKVVYPTEMKGQIYVPLINQFMLIGCIAVTLYFERSSNMEAAYGLSITLTMLMTTILFSFYLMGRGATPILVVLFLSVYLTIETSFLIANLSKFSHGGWVTLFLASIIFSVMWIWNQGSLIKRRYTEYVRLSYHLPLLKDLCSDASVPKYATHLVYMTGAPTATKIESKIIYSIFRKAPKRADVYWFIHVDVLDEPYTLQYKVQELVPGAVVRIDFQLGFRIEPRINFFFRKVIDELSMNNEIDIVSRYDSLRKNGIPGDFRFVVLEKTLSYENAFSFYENLIMAGYFAIKRFSLSEERSFGLDLSAVTSEKVPIVLAPSPEFELRRVY